MEDFEKLLDELSEKFKGKLIDRLETDGRRASGDLIRSVSHVVTKIFFGVQSEILWLQYGGVFETGVPAANIPFAGTNRNSGGGGISKYIQGLVNWINIKGFLTGLDKNPLSIAFAIAHKHKERGMPLDGNINVMTDTINEFIPYLEQQIDQETERIIYAQIDSLIADMSKTFSNIEEL
jgi:hypothetical protein